MPMQWDPLLTAALARELDGRLRGARVRSLLLDRASRRLILFLRDRTLAAELASGEGWISLLPPWEPPPGAISCPYSVGSVRAPPDESILILGLGRGRRGRRPREIILELIGNRRNALVVEREGRTIRHLLVGTSRGCGGWVLLTTRWDRWTLVPWGAEFILTCLWEQTGGD